MALKLEIRPGDTISIGDDIFLTLERKSGQTARLAITAPISRIVTKVAAASVTDNTAAANENIAERNRLVASTA